MTNVYLDRLRDERVAIRNKGEGMSTLTMSPVTEIGLLLVEAVTNLADTIQTIHEEGEAYEESREGRERT